MNWWDKKDMDSKRTIRYHLCQCIVSRVYHGCFALSYLLSSIQSIESPRVHVSAAREIANSFGVLATCKSDLNGGDLRVARMAVYNEYMFLNLPRLQSGFTGVRQATHNERNVDLCGDLIT